MSLDFLVGEPKFQHVFAQETLAAEVTNIFCSAVCMLLSVPGVTLYISECGDVRAL